MTWRWSVYVFSVYQGFGGNEAHKGEYANIVAQFADAIANGESPELFGNGTPTRDFTYIDDVVRVSELAADHELIGVYNVGTEEAYSFNEMVKLINDALGTDIDPEYIKCPFEGYVHDTCADISKIHETTGWKSDVSFEKVSNGCVSHTLTEMRATRIGRGATVDYIFALDIR
ncbi:hypothetical protein JCM31271_00440 [Halorubrum trueperi]